MLYSRVERAAKKVSGRKRHILVDTLGMILTAIVHVADIQDRDGAETDREGDSSGQQRLI